MAATNTPEALREGIPDMTANTQTPSRPGLREGKTNEFTLFVEFSKRVHVRDDPDQGSCIPQVSGTLHLAWRWLPADWSLATSPPSQRDGLSETSVTAQAATSGDPAPDTVYAKAETALHAGEGLPRLISVTLWQTPAGQRSLVDTRRGPPVSPNALARHRKVGYTYLHSATHRERTARSNHRLPRHLRSAAGTARHPP